MARADLLACRQTEPITRLIAQQLHLAEVRMQQGAALVHRVPGRAGWELRLVVQGGLRMVQRIKAMKFATISQRPTLGRGDLPLMLWRALWM